MRKSNQLALTSIAAFFLLATAFIFWTADKSSSDEEELTEKTKEGMIAFSEEQIAAAGIKIAEASDGTLKQFVETPGRFILNNDKIVHLLPKVSGIVKRSEKNLGQRVSKDELLAVLESREMAEVKSSYLAQLKKDQLNQTLLTTEEKLNEKKISSAHEYQQAKAAAEDSAINLELARQKLFSLGLTTDDIQKLPNEDPSTLSLYYLYAPMKGTVIHKHLSVGGLASLESEAYTIADLSDLWVEMTLYPSDLPLVKVGQTVMVIPSSGKPTKAIISYLSPIIDEDSRTGRAIAIIDNRLNQWNPGAYAAAHIETHRENVALAVPKNSIQLIEGQECLFVPNEKGFEIRPILTGKNDATHVEVLSGIAQGEKFACTNTFLLKADYSKDDLEEED